jgi:hypothetical protein
MYATYSTYIIPTRGDSYAGRWQSAICYAYTTYKYACKCTYAYTCINSNDSRIHLHYTYTIITARTWYVWECWWVSQKAHRHMHNYHSHVRIKDTDVGGTVRWNSGYRDLSASSEAVAPKLVTGTCIGWGQRRVVGGGRDGGRIEMIKME